MTGARDGVRRGRWCAALVVALALAPGAAGCGGEEPHVSSAVPPPASATDRLVFVVLGGDETDDPPGGGSLMRAWEQLVYAALPTSTVLVDLADRRPTARTVLRDQLPRAEALRPTVATVWLGAGDSDAGTGGAMFDTYLGEIVTGLQTAGARRVLLIGHPAPAGGPSPGGERYAPVLDAVAARTGAEVVTLPAGRASQETVAAAVRPRLWP
jgi:hypothetical protein